jgi:hypothetical protein
MGQCGTLVRGVLPADAKPVAVYHQPTVRNPAHIKIFLAEHGRLLQAISVG